MNKNIITVALFLFVVFVAGYLRISNINYGSEDEMTRPDESAYKDYVLWGIAKAFDQKLPENVGGFTATYINYLGILFCKFTLSNYEKLTNADLSQRQEFFSEAIHKPHKLFMEMRWISLVFSIGSIVMVFFLGRELFGSCSGIFSALLCAVSPLLITEGKSGKEDSLVLFFMLLAAYGLVVWIKREKL